MLVILAPLLGWMLVRHADKPHGNLWGMGMVWAAIAVAGIPYYIYAAGASEDPTFYQSALHGVILAPFALVAFVRWRRSHT